MRALAWHERQLADTKFRLKALAARYFVPPHVHSDAFKCPLCNALLSSDEQRALAAELAELQKDADEAERKIDDVCRGIEAELMQHLTAGLKQHRDLLSAMDPREDYVTAVLRRSCDEPPFHDVLIGLSGRIRATVLQQKTTLPAFSFPQFVDTTREPESAIALWRNFHGLERLTALVNWWSENRALFRNSWTAIIGRKQPDGGYPSASVEGELQVLEQALAKAAPLDDLTKFLLVAATAAESWWAIRKEQDLRKSIAKTLEPLKELRLLVGAETARSIANLSGRMKTILDRIHLRERLVYEQASLSRKTVNIAAWFEPGMQIDAALVANTSWLRAILWAFILALREETIESLGANPFPLVVLDDPQVTFDPRNKRKWAQEIARLANIDRGAKEGIQLLLTTHERQFLQCIVDHEKISGEQGMIGGVNKACGVATIVNGGCLERVWTEASSRNDDARARDYIADVRIYCEDLLKFMLRGEGPNIPGMSLDTLKNELKRLYDAHVPPFDRRVFGDLLNTLRGGGGEAMKLINESHHRDDELNRGGRGKGRASLLEPDASRPDSRRLCRLR